MTRRQLLFTLAASASAQPIAYRDYSRCLPDYLRALAVEAYQKRTQALASIQSPDAVRARQAWVRDTFWRLVGGRPERTALNARTTGTFQRAAYRVEKIVYESRPGLHVPALLYIPKSPRPPFPGVLFQMGHSDNGKAADTYQKCCQGLVQLGFLVLAFDPMGQGERVYYPQPENARTRLASSDDEHTVPGRQMLLVGDSATRLQVWDAVRSLDYLAAHPLVDPARLATTGQSGGGTLSMLLAAVDDRLAAAAISSGNTENFACADFNPPGSTDDAEQNLIGSGPVGFDRWDLLYPMAPKPLLILASAKDFFGTYSPDYLSSGREEFARLQKIYQTLDRPGQLAWVESPLPHGLSYNLRLRIYNWFSRWLQNDSAPVDAEPPVQIENDQTLWVSPGGNVVRALGSKTPFQLLKAPRVERVSGGGIVEVLAITRPESSLQASVISRVPSRRDVIVEAIEVAVGPQVRLPAWLYLPAGKAKSVLIAIEPGGRNGRWGEDAMYAKLAAQDYAICVPDLRGVGDLSPEYGRGAAHYSGPHHSEENYAWASMILGRPLLGQRVSDILGLAAALRRRDELKGLPLVVAAAGRMTVPALIAASLDNQIDRLFLAGGLVSWQNIIETENYTEPFANFAWDILHHTDLPALAQSILPRRIVIAGCVDAAGRKLSVAQVRAIYKGAAELMPDADWGNLKLLL